MNNIKTESEVFDWAKTIVKGKGDKYIPLGKADMYAIAEFVVKYAPMEEVQNPLPPSPEAETTADAPAKEEPAQEDKACTITVPSQGETRKVTMTRGYALHHAQFTTQQAYDKFLEWSREHPKEGVVMDFSTGVKSTNAAFAYWLMENIVVDVPANAR